MFSVQRVYLLLPVAEMSGALRGRQGWKCVCVGKESPPKGFGGHVDLCRPVRPLPFPHTIIPSHHLPTLFSFKVQATCLEYFL